MYPAVQDYKSECNLDWNDPQAAMEPMPVVLVFIGTVVNEKEGEIGTNATVRYADEVETS